MKGEEEVVIRNRRYTYPITSNSPPLTNPPAPSTLHSSIIPSTTPAQPPQALPLQLLPLHAPQPPRRNRFRQPIQQHRYPRILLHESRFRSRDPGFVQFGKQESCEWFCSVILALLLFGGAEDVVVCQEVFVERGEEPSRGFRKWKGGSGGAVLARNEYVAGGEIVVDSDGEGEPRVLEEGELGKGCLQELLEPTFIIRALTEASDPTIPERDTERL